MPKLSRVEKAAVPALVGIVPKFLAWTLTYEGWRERVLQKPFAVGTREEVLLHAFETWRGPPMKLVRQGWRRNVGSVT